MPFVKDGVQWKIKNQSKKKHGETGWHFQNYCKKFTLFFNYIFSPFSFLKFTFATRLFFFTLQSLNLKEDRERLVGFWLKREKVIFNTKFHEIHFQLGSWHVICLLKKQKEYSWPKHVGPLEPAHLGFFLFNFFSFNFIP
jgi:hypothetical protein